MSPADRITNAVGKALALLPNNHAARGWVEEIGIVIRQYEHKQCANCDGQGRVYQNCDCHDPHNCVHRDGTTCRKCRGIGLVFTEKESRP